MIEMRASIVSCLMLPDSVKMLKGNVISRMEKRRELSLILEPVERDIALFGRVIFHPNFDNLLNTIMFSQRKEHKYVAVKKAYQILYIFNESDGSYELFTKTCTRIHSCGTMEFRSTQQ